MQESGWWQQALESAVYESNAMADKIGLARLAILEKLVSQERPNPNDEDKLLDALDTLRALDWERLSDARETLNMSVAMP